MRVGSIFKVTPADSARNTTWGDVIGSKLDTYEGDSLYSQIMKVLPNVRSERLVYPTLAAGATVVSANTDWTYGNYATVIPINTVVNPFHILALSIESCDRNAVFQLELYKGAADDIVTGVRFAVEGGFFGNQVYVVGSEQVDANSQIRARIASSDGTALIATITLSVVYYVI
jgi:hypothetical protein